MAEQSFEPVANTSAAANELINKARAKMIFIIDRANLKTDD